MARDRNKPTQSWMERAKIEIKHEELTIERAYEIGKIRGEKEQKAIDEANPSDAVIMRILNAIGYEEESWIPIVRKNLETMEE